VQFVPSQIGINKRLTVGSFGLFVLAVDLEISQFLDIYVKVNGSFLLFT